MTDEISSLRERITRARGFRDAGLPLPPAETPAPTAAVASSSVTRPGEVTRVPREGDELLLLKRKPGGKWILSQHIEIVSVRWDVVKFKWGRMSLDDGLSPKTRTTMAWNQLQPRVVPHTRQNREYYSDRG